MDVEWLGLKMLNVFFWGPKGVKIKLHMKGDQVDSMENTQKIKKVVLKGNTFNTPWRQLVEFWMIKWLPPWSFNSSPLKNGGWKTILSYWVLVTFRGRELLNFRGVSIFQFCQDQASGTWLFHVQSRKRLPGRINGTYIGGQQVSAREPKGDDSGSCLFSAPKIDGNGVTVMTK